MYHSSIPPAHDSEYANASSEQTKTSGSYCYYSPRYQSPMISSPKKHSRRASRSSDTPTYTSYPHDSSPHYTSPYTYSSSYTKAPITYSPYTPSSYVNIEKPYTYNYYSTPATSKSFEVPSTYESTPFDHKHDTVKSRKTFTNDTGVGTSVTYSTRNWNKTKAADKGAKVCRLTLSPHPSVPKKSRKTTNNAVAYDIPAGYSLRNWDPTEEPILLLGSVFDANSLGKWIYDWTVSKDGLLSPMTDFAGDLWLLLLKLTSKIKSVRPMFGGLPRHGNTLRMFSLGILLKAVSALPIDPGETTSSSSGRPGGLDLLGWPSPCLGIVFAAAATFFSRPHSKSRVPGAMALVFNYLSLVASGDATATPAVMWT